MRPARHVPVLVLLVALLGVPAAHAQDGPPPEADPVATALAWSARHADGAVGQVLLGTTASFADSLASGGAQGVGGHQLLLTGPDALDPRVADELQRLGATAVVLLGGEVALSAQVAADAAALGLDVSRVAGDTRITTALAVADAFFPAPTGVVVARAFGDEVDESRAFVDSLGAGALAAATGQPILLTGSEALDPAVAAWLQASPATAALVVGGETALAPRVVADLQALGLTVERLAGPTRFETAREVRGTQLVATGADDAAAVLIEGQEPLAWTSGFAAALHAREGGILLTAEGDLPSATASELLGVGAMPDCGPLVEGTACAQGIAAATTDLGIPPTHAVLDDAQEVPPTGTGGSGWFQLHARAADDAVCYRYQAIGLTGPAQAAHVHAAPFGVNGDIVVPLSVAASSDGVVTGCAVGVEEAALAAIEADPAAFYVNVHTAAHPAGEVRGQLFPEGRVLVATLDGASEVPGPGHPTASGSAVVFETGVADELCYGLQVVGLPEPAQMAHIHVGGPDVAGGIVHPLALPTTTVPAATDAAAVWRCDRGIDPDVVQAVLDDPDGHYVNVHTATFPAGAVRGQLALRGGDV